MSSYCRVIRNNKFAILPKYERKAEQLLEDAARTTTQMAQAIVPVKTGALRDSIRFYKVARLHWRVVVKKFYAIFVEFGTVKVAARPFLLPAYYYALAALKLALDALK